MKIYTRDGDDGSTDLGGRRIRKSAPRCEAVGTIDELNCHIGLCLQSAEAAGQQDIRESLGPIQEDLFAAAALLAGAGAKVSLDEAAVGGIEERLDAVSAKLGEVRHLVVPAGCELSCRLHVARGVCRRAERAVVAAEDAGVDVPPVVLQYMNRLSDFLFVLARLANHQAGVQERLWRP